MTNEQAIELIMTRREELLKDNRIKKQMANMYKNNSSIDEINEWLTLATIATLVF